MPKKVTLRSDAARARLVSLNLTQSSLALICELDIRTVQRWFAGRPVRLEEAERVASVLRLGTADLFDGVPEEGTSSVLALFSLLGRLPGLREHPSAQVLRSVPLHFAEFMAPLLFRPYPLRGYVTPFPLRSEASKGFIALRLTPSADHCRIQILIRLGRSVLDERAYLLVRGDDVWLVENHMVRSMRARRRAEDGSFDVWYWVGEEASELLIVCPLELSVCEAEVPSAQRTLFDMSCAVTEHAVCIRPAITHIVAAGRPRGFDRVGNRDPARVDIEVPECE